MKKIKFKKCISFILSVALVAGCIYLSEPMETEAATVPTKFDEIEADTLTNITVGKAVTENFANVNEGEVPDGWLSYEGSWVWNTGENQTDVVEVQTKEDKKYLKISDTDRTVALVFPSIGTANYMVTAKVCLDTLQGTIGLITNITDPVSESGTNNANNAVTMALLGLTKDSGTQKHMSELKNRAVNADVTNTSEKKAVDIECQQGQIVTLTACRYVHYTYFYIGDTYIGKKKNIGFKENNSLCGFYVCGGTVSLQEVTISELVRGTSTDIRPHVEVVENVIDEDFTQKGAGASLPEGWRLIKGSEGKSWLWNNTSNASATQSVEQKDTGLFFQATASDGALLAPVMNTVDYVMTTKVVCTSNSGHIGLLSNVNENVGATRSVINMKNDGEPIITQRNRVTNTTPQLQIVARAEVMETPPGQNSAELTLTIYSFRGVSYFYVDGVFVQELAQHNPQSESTRCGFVVCGAGMMIKNVRIDAIQQTGDIAREVYATDTILSQEFTEAEGTLPEGWQILQDKWIWNPKNEGADTVTVAGSEEQKYLEVTDWDGSVGIILPAIGTADYVMTAKITPTTYLGTVGLMTNIKEPLDKGVGATHSILNLKNSGRHTGLVEQNYKHENMTTYDKKNFYISLLGGDAIGGSSNPIDLTVYSYQGYSYFYVNGKLVLYTANRNAELETSMCGLYVCGASIKVNSVSVKKLESKEGVSAVQMIGAAVRYADADGVARATSSGMRFVAEADKDSFLYKSSENIQIGMIIGSAATLEVGDSITLDSEGVVDFPLDEIVSEDDKTLQFATTLVGVTDLDEYYAARAYIKVDGEYYYSNQIERSQARLATRLAADEKIADEKVIEKLETIFGGTEGFVKPDEVKTLDFTVLADLHYKQGMYAASIEDLTTILARAEANNSSFVMHMGDFCNDYRGSVELTDTYLASEIPAYGIYGNHELESANNSMEYVTPLLTNQADEVTWGTADGNIDESGAIAYYYFEKEGFRIVCTDSNYSWNAASGEWQHNTTNSWGSPDGNTMPNSLGDIQLAWLEDVLTDAARKSIPCVVLSHATMSGSWEPSPDSAAVQDIFRRVNAIQKGTVLLALNGHNHQDHMKIVDDVVYIDINTVRNGFWDSNGQPHYTDDQTFEFVKYNADGSVASTEIAPLNSLSSSAATWFFAEPLSANIRISTAGYIHVDGWQTSWLYDVEPDVTEGQARFPWISDYKIDFLY